MMIAMIIKFTSGGTDRLHPQADRNDFRYINTVFIHTHSLSVCLSSSHLQLHLLLHAPTSPPLLFVRLTFISSTLGPSAARLNRSSNCCSISSDFFEISSAACGRVCVCVCVCFYVCVCMCICVCVYVRMCVCVC